MPGERGVSGPAGALTVADLAALVEGAAAAETRAALIELTAGLFRRATPAEASALADLLRGRLTPPFLAATSLPLAPALLVQALAAAFGLSEAQVGTLHTSMGELGAVVLELAHGAGRPGLLEAYRELVGIAADQGAGAEGRRCARLAALLAVAEPESGAFLVRLAGGTLHLGIGAATIVDALVRARSGEPTDRAALRLAFDRSGDLGAVARQYLEGGTRALAAFRISVGHPVRPALAERLPDAGTVLAHLGEVAVEPKYNGRRVQVHRQGPHVRLFGRALEDLTAMFPEIVAAVAGGVGADDVIIDGEIVAVHRPSGEFVPFPFDRAEPGSGIVLRYYAFDLLYVDGQDITGLGYLERHARLERLLPPDSSLLAYSRAETAASSEQLQRLLDAYVADGLEGVMCKRPEAVYRIGVRSYDQVKLKRAEVRWLIDTVDAVVVGLTGPSGAAEPEGAVLLALYDDEIGEYASVGLLGAGLGSDGFAAIARRVEPYLMSSRPLDVRAGVIPDRWVRPALVIEVAAEEIVPSALHSAGALSENSLGCALRGARLIRIRDDRGAEQATTARELRVLYAAQGTRSGDLSVRRPHWIDGP